MLEFVLVALIPIPPAVILYAWSDARNHGWRVRAAAFTLPLAPWVVWCIYLMFFIISSDAEVVADIGAFILSCSAASAVCSALGLFGLAWWDGHDKAPVMYDEATQSNSGTAMSDNPYQSPQSVMVVPAVERKPTITSAIGFLLVPVATILLLPAIPKPPVVGIFFTAMFFTTGGWWLATRRGWASTVVGMVALLLSLTMFWIMVDQGYWQG